MNIFITIIIFIVVLLLYLHIFNEYKYKEELYIYDIDFESRKQLQQICELKHPYVFNLNIPSIENTSDIKAESNVKIYDTSDNDYVELPYASFNDLINKDNDAKYYSENNNNFAKNEMYTIFSNIEPYIKPYLAYNTEYDIIMGSKNAYTSFKYHYHSALFLFVYNGSCNIKISPYNKNLITDTLTNITQYNPFSENKYHVNDITLSKNQCLFIPTWCFYSIQMDVNTIICSIKYSTPTNIIINIPRNIIKYVQNMNVEEKVLKTIELPKMQEENEEKKEMCEEKE